MAAAGGWNAPEVTTFPEDVVSLLTDAPYLLIALHGAYAKPDPTQPLTTYTVPANMCIFETQAIGDLCRMYIIPDLEDLLDEREPFVNTLLTTDIDRDALAVIKNLNFYKAGDQIYPRMLTGGDPGEPIGITLYFPNGKRASLPGPAKGELVDTGSVLEGVFTRYPKLRELGLVVFFASCAVWGGLQDDEIERIMSHQYEQRRKFMGYTPAAPGGGIEVPRTIVDANATGNVAENAAITKHRYHDPGPNVNAWLERSAAAGGAPNSQGGPLPDLAGSKRRRTDENQGNPHGDKQIRGQKGGRKGTGRKSVRRKRSGRKGTGRKTRRRMTRR